MKVLYFTSTGNCLYAARKTGGEVISIVQAVKNNQYEFKDEKIGIVFPVYGLCIPPYIKDFLSKARFNCSYLFAIVTYGFYAGATVTDLINTADKYGIHFDYIKKVKMVENYIPGFEMKKEIGKVSETNIDEALDSIVAEIKAGKKAVKGDSAINRFMTWTHSKKYAYNLGEGFTSNYKIEDSCKGCGICAKVCPMDNITIEEGRPVFGTNCISCLACTQNCPQNSIRMDKEKSIKRYRNSHIALEDIVNSNK